MNENEKKERYLFISCAGSGYQDEIIEFLKDTYIKNGEYYDHLQIVGSILPLITPELNNSYVFSSTYIFFEKLYKSLRSQVYYLISKHQLSKVVVISEPKCAFYEDLMSFIGMNKDFLSQKEIVFQAAGALEDFLSTEFGREKIGLEVWYMLLKNEQIFYEKVFYGKLR